MTARKSAANPAPTCKYTSGIFPTYQPTAPDHVLFEGLDLNPFYGKKFRLQAADAGNMRSSESLPNFIVISSREEPDLKHKRPPRMTREVFGLN
jgi:hypothetical protein